jgi:hypothetical protein
MGKIGSFFLGLLVGLLTGVVVAVVVFVLSTRWTVSQGAAFRVASALSRHA